MLAITLLLFTRIFLERLFSRGTGVEKERGWGVKNTAGWPAKRKFIGAFARLLAYESGTGTGRVKQMHPSLRISTCSLSIPLEICDSLNPATYRTASSHSADSLFRPFCQKAPCKSRLQAQVACSPNPCVMSAGCSQLNGESDDLYLLQECRDSHC